MNTDVLRLGARLHEEVLSDLKRAFVGKDEIIDVLGVALVAGENLFMLGPPGTAKSAIVHELGRRLDGNTFEYLLTRFTEPNELFGPFDIRRLREGDLVTNISGMLPEASLVFLDELLNANSAILNSLLTVLNERVLRRGREEFEIPALSIIGASNHLPEDETLGALFDRFLVRVRCDNVAGERLEEVLAAGWSLESRAVGRPTVSVDDVRELGRHVPEVDLAPVTESLVDLVRRLRQAGIPVSDRRAVKLQRLVAGSALLCGRLQAHGTDLWVLRHTWDTLEQEQVISALVGEVVEQGLDDEVEVHPRARSAEQVDPETMAKDLADLSARLEAEPGPRERSIVRDRLVALEGQLEWVTTELQREALKERVAELWERLGRS